MRSALAWSVSNRVFLNLGLTSMYLLSACTGVFTPREELWESTRWITNVNPMAYTLQGMLQRLLPIVFEPDYEYETCVHRLGLWILCALVVSIGVVTYRSANLHPNQY